MRPLAILTFVTLDGVMQAPSVPEEDTSGDFKHGGWARPCWEEVMEQVTREAMSEPYDLLLGRTTYDMFATSFANADEGNPVASKLNQATKYVVTSSRDGLDWQNTEQITGDVAAEVARLKEGSGALLQVHGSWELVQTLLQNALVDELRLWTFPVVVGSGKRLFDTGSPSRRFSLVKTDTTPNGAVMTIYRRRAAASS